MAKMDLENNGVEMSREVELGVNLEDISLLRKKEAGAMKEEGLNIVLMRESQYEEIVVQDRTLDPTKHSTVIVANKSVSIRTSSMQRGGNIATVEKLGWIIINELDNKTQDRRDIVRL